MAEDSSSHPPSDTSSLSNKRSVTLTLSPEHPSSLINPVFDEPQVSPEHSPKKPKPNSRDCPLHDFNLADGGDACEVASEITTVPMSLGSVEVSGVVLGEKILALGGLNDNVVKDADVSEQPLISEGNNNVHSESFGPVLQKNDECSSGIQEISADLTDEVSEKVVEFDRNNEVYGVELGGKNVGFDRKGEIDEFLELKDDSVIGRENSSEIVQLGTSETQSDGAIKATALCSTSNKNKCVEKGDLPIYSMTVELVDETAVVDVLVNGGKKSRRKGRKGDFNAASGSECSDGAKRVMKYSRKEMEKLRFVNAKAQKSFWQEVYNGLTDTVRKEYSALGSFKHHKQGGMNSQQGADKKSCSDQGLLLGDSSSGNVSCDAEMLSPTHASFNGEHIGRDGDDLEWIEDEESDDEYRSLRRPAFMVQGDPDFESGPPEDGLEYLRRVRWEAARIPKVKVANVDRGKLKEQSFYMPKIPDIENCPPHLAPSSQWEDEFIADFSELRLALSDLDDTNDAASVDSQTIVFGCPVATKRTCKTLPSLELPAEGPTLSAIHGMDAVTRVALLNKRIHLFENATHLSKDDCAWLFALCAVVETPLHADTCASMRCLLRRCAKLRAEKPEVDDEVVMLNIMATIAGKYFKQSEN